MLAMPGWFIPGQSEETEVAIREEFLRALDGIPQWAIHRAFDAWTKTAKRRPCPADIIELAQAELSPIFQQINVASQNIVALTAPKREPVTAERANEILELAGFRPRKFEVEKP